MNEPEKYWFPAKRYGWGWGLPSTWQGWIVLAGLCGVAGHIGTALITTVSGEICFDRCHHRGSACRHLLCQGRAALLALGK